MVQKRIPKTDRCLQGGCHWWKSHPEHHRGLTLDVTGGCSTSAFSRRMSPVDGGDLLSSCSTPNPETDRCLQGECRWYKSAPWHYRTVTCRFETMLDHMGRTEPQTQGYVGRLSGTGGGEQGAIYSPLSAVRSPPPVAPRRESQLVPYDFAHPIPLEPRPLVGGSFSWCPIGNRINYNDFQSPTRLSVCVERPLVKKTPLRAVYPCPCFATRENQDRWYHVFVRITYSYCRWAL